MIRSDIKMLLSVRDVKQQDLIPVLEMSSKQAVNNKFAKNTFSANELCKIVHFLGGRLVVKFDDGREFEIRGDEE